MGARPLPTQPVYVFNLVQGYDASISLRLEGSPDFVIVGDAERRLWPTTEGMPAPIIIEFRPTARTEAKALLRVRATWRMDVVAPAEVEIALTGQAHLDGESSHAEASAQALQSNALRAAARARAAHDAAASRAIARDEQIARPYPHQGQASALDRIYEEAKVALDAIGRQQEHAIDTAKDEAFVFKRKEHRRRPSAIIEIALRALNLTAVGLAATVAGELKRGLKPGSGRARTLNPSEAAVDWVAEIVKTIFKDTAKDYLGGLGASSSAEATDHKEEAIYVFAAQKSVFTAIQRDRGESLVLAYSELKAKLRSDGKAAIRAMTELRDALRKLEPEANRLQLIQSRMAWMSTLSQDALGSASSPIGAITNIGGANDFPTETGPVPPIEGIIDVEFVAEFTAATTPIAVRAIRSIGVTQESLRRGIANNGFTLRGLPVVIRATGHTDGFAVFAVCVTQDEAGGLTFRDETTAVGPGTWLSKHVGVWGSSAQQTGARALMDEILDADVGRIAVTTDHQQGSAG